MVVTSLVVVVVPRTGECIKNGLNIFEGEKNCYTKYTIRCV